MSPRRLTPFPCAASSLRWTARGGDVRPGHRPVKSPKTDAAVALRPEPAPAASCAHSLSFSPSFPTRNHSVPPQGHTVAPSPGRFAGGPPPAASGQPPPPAAHPQPFGPLTPRHRRRRQAVIQRSRLTNATPASLQPPRIDQPREAVTWPAAQHRAGHMGRTWVAGQQMRPGRVHTVHHAPRVAQRQPGRGGQVGQRVVRLVGGEASRAGRSSVTTRGVTRRHDGARCAPPCAPCSRRTPPYPHAPTCTRQQHPSRTSQHTTSQHTTSQHTTSQHTTSQHTTLHRTAPPWAPCRSRWPAARPGCGARCGRCAANARRARAPCPRRPAGCAATCRPR